MDARSGIGKVSYSLIGVHPLFAAYTYRYLSKSEKLSKSEDNDGSKQVHDEIIRKSNLSRLLQFALLPL